MISKEEVTNEMEQLSDGLYQLGEKLYEVIDDKKDSSIISQKLNKTQTGTMASDAASIYLTIFFVFSVLFLAFTVLCLYVGIYHIVVYEKFMNHSNQLGTAGEILADIASDPLRDGVLWILGGAASLILGGILALIYNIQKK